MYVPASVKSIGEKAFGYRANGYKNDFTIYGYSGTEAEADLRGIKKEYEKRDVILFAAAIGDDKENIRRIYKDGFLDITKLEELPKNMAQLVKQHLK